MAENLKNRLAHLCANDLFGKDIAPARLFLKSLEELAKEHGLVLEGGSCVDDPEYFDIWASMDEKTDTVTVGIDSVKEEIRVWAIDWDSAYLIAPVGVVCRHDEALEDVLESTITQLAVVMAQYKGSFLPSLEKRIRVFNGAA